MNHYIAWVNVIGAVGLIVAGLVFLYRGMVRDGRFDWVWPASANTAIGGVILAAGVLEARTAVFRVWDPPWPFGRAEPVVAVAATLGAVIAWALTIRVFRGRLVTDRDMDRLDRHT